MWVVALKVGRLMVRLEMLPSQAIVKSGVENVTI